MLLASSYIRIQLGEKCNLWHQYTNGGALCDTSILIVKLCVSKYKWEIVELGWWVVRVSAQARCLYSLIHPGPTALSAGDFYSNIRWLWDRDLQYESAEASFISRLSFALLLLIQWLSGKSLQVVIGRSRVDSQLDLCGFSFLLKAYILA